MGGPDGVQEGCLWQSALCHGPVPTVIGSPRTWGLSCHELSCKIYPTCYPGFKLQAGNLRWINVLLGMWGNCGWQVHGLFQGVVAPAAPGYNLGIFLGNVWDRLAYACNSRYFNGS